MKWPDRTNPGATWAALGGNGIFNTALAYMPVQKLVIIAASTDARLQIEEKLPELRPLIQKLVN